MSFAAGVCQCCSRVSCCGSQVSVDPEPTERSVTIFASLVHLCEKLNCGFCMCVFSFGTKISAGVAGKYELWADMPEDGGGHGLFLSFPCKL